MIPVSEPWIGEEELIKVTEAIRNGEISGTFGTTLTEFEHRFAGYCGCKYGIATSSGTTALHLAVSAAGIGSGDEILVSASTNIATALAIVHNGAVPVPVDSERTSWNLDLDLLEQYITPSTRAIIPVHLFGHPVDMDRLMEIASRHNLIVIEDCAEAHGAKCRGRVTGSFGDMGCFSFYANKIITTGEGGMVVTNDAALAKQLKLLRNLGFTQPRFKHDVLGFNFRMTGYQAAMGLAQLDRIETIIQKKRELAKAYTDQLCALDEISVPAQADWAEHVYWMYGIVVNRGSKVTRDQLAERLHTAGIETRTFFCPMNQQPCLQAIKAFRSLPCPVADELWDQGLYLPSSPQLQVEQIDYIASAVKKSLRVG